MLITTCAYLLTRCRTLELAQGTAERRAKAVLSVRSSPSVLSELVMKMRGRIHRSPRLDSCMLHDRKEESAESPAPKEPSGHLLKLTEAVVEAE